MKYSLSAGVELMYKHQADELKVPYSQIDNLLDICEGFEEKNIVIDLSFFRNRYEYYEVDWEKIVRYNDLLKNVIVCCNNVREMAFCKENDIRFFWAFPVETFSDLRGLKELGACYVRIGAPLFFKMPIVKEIGVPVRIIANTTYQTNALPILDITSQPFIRPEDINVYEEYVDIIEFDTEEDIKKEQALFRIYRDGKWPGELSMILNGYDGTGSNALIDPEFGKIRINCRQRCLENDACHYCKAALGAADRELLSDYIKEKNLVDFLKKL